MQGPDQGGTLSRKRVGITTTHLWPDSRVAVATPLAYLPAHSGAQYGAGSMWEGKTMDTRRGHSALPLRAGFGGSLPGSVLLACAMALGGLPLSASAQSGAALFAVGEPPPKSSRAKPKQAQPPKASSGDKATPRQGSRKTASNASRRGKRAVQPSPVALNGRWHDSECIPLTGATHRPPLYVKRVYEFADARKTWRLDATVYTAESCLRNTRLLSYHGEGTFSISGKSRVAGDAYDADFRIHRWSATPETRDGVLALLNGRCGSGDFEEGRALDLSATGCRALGIRPIDESPSDVELVSVRNGKFFLGSRSFMPGQGDDRPTQLSSYGLVSIP